MELLTGAEAPGNEWRDATRDPDVVRATLEDYRAGLTIDRIDEEADKTAGHRLEMQLLTLGSLRDDLDSLYGDALRIWREWAMDVHGFGIDSAHHVAEEAPDELARALTSFFTSTSPSIVP